MISSIPSLPAQGLAARQADPEVVPAAGSAAGGFDAVLALLAQALVGRPAGEEGKAPEAEQEVAAGPETSTAEPALLPLVAEGVPSAVLAAPWQPSLPAAAGEAAGAARADAWRGGLAGQAARVPYALPQGSVAIAAQAAPAVSLPGTPLPLAADGDEAPAPSPLAGGRLPVLPLADATPLPQAGALPSGVQPAQGAGPSIPEWSALTLPGKREGWQDPLRAALGERLSVQSAHGIDRALIRLDPPNLGGVEIALRHEAGVLNVQLTASNAEVARQLSALSEMLRQDLGNRQYAQVTVDVREGTAGSGQQRQGQGQGQEGNPRTPGRALDEDAWAGAGHGDGAYASSKQGLA